MSRWKIDLSIIKQCSLLSEAIWLRNQTEQCNNRLLLPKTHSKTPLTLFSTHHLQAAAAPPSVGGRPEMLWAPCSRCKASVLAISPHWADQTHSQPADNKSENLTFLWLWFTLFLFYVSIVAECISHVIFCSDSLLIIAFCCICSVNTPYQQNRLKCKRSEGDKNIKSTELHVPPPGAFHPYWGFEM